MELIYFLTYFNYHTYFYRKFRTVKTIFNHRQMALIVQRLSHQIVEQHIDLKDTVIIGLQPRGIFLSNRIVAELKNIVDPTAIQYGKLDITFYRDDIRKELHIANKTEIPFSIENKKVVIIDDVLYTGRTIRAALDALLDFGRPSKVSLCVLIDRRFKRELPIEANYIGRAIDTLSNEKVMVRWSENAGTDSVEIV